MFTSKSSLTKRLPEDAEREDRILFEIVVDAYNDTERALGWYYYLQEALSVPFDATCTSTFSTSPLMLGQQVEVLGMADEDDCMFEMTVMVKFGLSELAVPLSRLKCLSSDEGTLQAVQDWHYWVGRGYLF
jgi:hypothetical protein